MHRFFARFKLRSKLLAGFAILLGIVLLAFSLIRIRLLEVHGEILTLVNERRPIELLSTQMDARLDDTLSALGLFASVHDQVYANNYHSALAEALRICEKLQGNALIVADPRLSSMLAGIRTDIVKLSALGEQLLRLSSNDEATFPALAYANEHINPVNRVILQMVSQLLHDEQNRKRNDDYRLLLRAADLRYYWISVISGVRAYLAYRGESIVQDTELYIESARKALQDISSEGDRLDLDEEQVIQQLRDAIGRFGQHWERLQAIQRSDAWRADSHLMRTRIAPLFGAIERQLAAFTDVQSNALNAVDARLVAHSQRISAWSEHCCSWVC